MRLIGPAAVFSCIVRSRSDPLLGGVMLPRRLFLMAKPTPCSFDASSGFPRQKKV